MEGKRISELVVLEHPRALACWSLVVEICPDYQVF